MDLSIQTIFERANGVELARLPDELRVAYGGDFRLPESPAERPLVVANFASTLDGVVSFDIYLASPEAAQSAVRMQVTISSWVCCGRLRMLSSWVPARLAQYPIATCGSRSIFTPRWQNSSENTAGR